MRTRLPVLFLVMLILVGCGRRNTGAVATVRPTLTLTPFSTPLAYLPTPVPAGSSENPIQLVVVASDNTPTDADRQALETAISTAVNVQIKVITVNTQIDAVQALCDSSKGTISLVWLDTLAYAIAQAKGCGLPVLRLEKDQQFGEQAVIVTRQDTLTTDLTALQSQSYCRVSTNDVYSWIIPTLMLRSNNFNPDVLGVMIENTTPLANLAAVSGSICYATAVAQSTYDELVNDNSAAVKDLRVIETSPTLPFAILMIPPTMPLREGNAVLDTLLSPSESRISTLEATEEPIGSLDRSLVEAVLGSGEIVTVAPDDLAEIDTFLQSTGLDFAQLGQR